MIFCIRIKLRMNIHQVLFFCFLSALQDGDTGLTNAVALFAGAEGGSGSLGITFTSSGNTKFFCKGECKEENILIKTDDVTAQSGRYSIRSETSSTGRRITVTITQLTKSDSGRYRYGLGGSRSLFPDDYSEFDLIVTDGATLGINTRFVRTITEGESVTHGCLATVNGSRKFFCKGECKKEEDILVETAENRAQSGRYSIKYIEGSEHGLYVTITQLKKSDSVRYRCGYGRPSSPDSSYSFSIFVAVAPTTEEPTSVPSASTPATTQSLTSSSANSGVCRPGYFCPLVVCVPVIVVLVAVVLLLVYKLKMMRNSGLNTRETSDNRNKENRDSGSMTDDNVYDDVYQSLDTAGMDPDQTYSALRETTNM